MCGREGCQLGGQRRRWSLLSRRRNPLMIPLIPRDANRVVEGTDGGGAGRGPCLSSLAERALDSNWMWSREKRCAEVHRNLLSNRTLAPHNMHTHKPGKIGKGWRR